MKDLRKGGEDTQVLVKAPSNCIFRNESKGQGGKVELGTGGANPFLFRDRWKQDLWKAQEALNWEQVSGHAPLRR